MAHRPFTLRQQRENERFLDALRRTGNVRLACRELGLNRSTYTRRRGKCAAFATRWDMTLAAAHAALHLAGGDRMPEAKRLPGTVEGAPGGTQLRTRGGEPVIVRRADGRLQLRLAPPGRMTDAAGRLVLATVAETNNLRMAARAAGVAHSTILARCRLRPDLARELRVARRIGADRVMWQYLHPPGRPDPAGDSFALLPMPPTTAEQAILQLVYHHPDGRFRRSLWRRRPPPLPFSRVEPRIRAKLAVWRRAEWHRATGRWRFPDEENEATPGLSA